MLETLRTLATQQLDQVDTQIRLIFLHPNFAEQHILLSHLPADHAVYVCFRGHRLAHADVRRQLETAISHQSGDRPLAQIPLLILDECDRIHSDALDILLPEMAAEIGSGRVVVISRTLPQCVITDKGLRKRSVFIPNHEGIMLWDYAQRDSATALLEVRAFGGGRVLLNGRLVDNWDGMLPRSLFFYLVDRGMATRNAIFETFWPTLNIREATNVFHVTKRKISEVLGMDLTTYTSGYYCISSSIQLSYDVVLFTELVNNSAVLPKQEAQAALIQAISLYQGDYLRGTDHEWARHRREELVQDFGEALALLAKSHEDLGDIPHALGLYLRAAAIHQERSKLIASIMTLYRHLHLPEDALKAFEQFASAPPANGDEMPSPMLAALAEEIRRTLPIT